MTFFTKEQIRERLKKQIDYRFYHRKFEIKELIGDFDHNQELKQSAVLLLIFPQQNELYTVVIRRVQDGTVHSGQIGLPGGQKEESDKSLCHTALRETYEELGIDREKIEILGRLNEVVIPVSQFVVQPYVGWLEFLPDIFPNKLEISEIYFLPLKSFLEKNTIVKKRIKVRGKCLQVPGYLINNIFIWGATAKIFSEFTGYLNLDR